MSGDGERWFLINASPDLRQQIQARAILHPRRGLRSSPIEGVVLTGADVDAIAGLLHLRERQPFTLYASQRVLAVLDGQSDLRRAGAETASAARPCRSAGRSSCAMSTAAASGLEVELFDVPGKVALYLETGDPRTISPASRATRSACEVRAGGRRLLYIPGCARMTDALRRRLAGASVVLFDGTLWRDDEMMRAGLGPKTGQRMGHMSVSGPDGTIAAFRDIAVSARSSSTSTTPTRSCSRIRPSAPSVEAAGWEVAYDGMEVSP